ncbi:phosphatidylserine synthase [Saprospira grandis DSM 2844]|uniref:Phosphatidylserine synthase n=1 Tax=Saprospira grandis DSM 2844 TaxID=694433 RepID=J1I2Q9_9BACT|nr:CDP-alcohol phosphatidyltransferase family protein [Saprospira grandis]EJF52995.1 phosphatidylserine synthase [Saprospira grandis DSM 2844]
MWSKIKQQIPNSVTLLNAWAGAAAIISLFSGQWEVLPYCLLLSLIADFGDGLLARLLKAQSPLGKELDSLADLISFGFFPAAMLYQLFMQALGLPEGLQWGQRESYLLLLPFLLLLFSALRLAKFNTDSRQSESFIGLNTPATTLFVFGYFWTVQQQLYGLEQYLLWPPLLYGLLALLCYLLIAEIPLLSFKFKSLAWRPNRWRFLLILGLLPLLIFLPLGLALPAGILLYLLLSVVAIGVGDLRLGE